MITIAKAIQNNLIDEDTGVFLGASKVADFDRGNFYAALGQQTAKIRLEHKAFALGAVPGTPGTKAYICLDSAEPSGE
ncbi:hypothetical protein QO874_001125 [Salmonella enterica]|nr:hypothetical protein [Salmonella enterica]ELS7100789.1 hypothetical protein [Salmonella enterica]